MLLIKGTSFNEFGYALASTINMFGDDDNIEMVNDIKNQYILFDNGIYCNMKKYQKLCIESEGIVSSIKQNLEKRKILALQKYNTSNL